MHRLVQMFCDVPHGLLSLIFVVALASGSYFSRLTVERKISSKSTILLGVSLKINHVAAINSNLEAIRTLKLALGNFKD